MDAAGGEVEDRLIRRRRRLRLLQGPPQPVTPDEPDSRHYYWNANTNEVLWELPPDAAAPPGPGPAVPRPADVLQLLQQQERAKRQKT